MATAKCSACEKILDIEPVKCPYCGVLQLNKAVDWEMVRLQKAVIGLLALLVGLPSGFFLGRQRTAQAPALTPQTNQAMPVRSAMQIHQDNIERFEAIRRRMELQRQAAMNNPQAQTAGQQKVAKEYQDNLAALPKKLQKSPRCVFADAETLSLEPKRFLGGCVSMVGRASKIGGTSESGGQSVDFFLSKHFMVPEGRTFVDADSAPLEARKRLLQYLNGGGPVVVAWGALVPDDPTADSHYRSVAGYCLRLERLEVLGFTAEGLEPVEGLLRKYSPAGAHGRGGASAKPCRRPDPPADAMGRSEAWHRKS